jgi:glycosyltransferase involved in cell wall biosynthesis
MASFRNNSSIAFEALDWPNDLSCQDKDVGLIYGALDVFLMTSRYEGTPNVL